MAHPPPNPPLSPTPATAPTADRPPSTPRWVWVLGSVVGLFLLAVAVFFLAGGDHGGGGGHGAGNGTGAVDGGTAPDVPMPAAGLQVATSGYTLSPVTVPHSADEAGTVSIGVLGPDEPLMEFTEAQDKDRHLIAVRTDTADYRNAHPTVDADGAGRPSTDQESTSGGH